MCIRLARDPERNGFAAETEWTGRLLATEETQRRVADFLAGARHEVALAGQHALGQGRARAGEMDENERPASGGPIKPA